MSVNEHYRSVNSSLSQSLNWTALYYQYQTRERAVNSERNTDILAWGHLSGLLLPLRNGKRRQMQLRAHICVVQETKEHLYNMKSLPSLYKATHWAGIQETFGREPNFYFWCIGLEFCTQAATHCFAYFFLWQWGLVTWSSALYVGGMSSIHSGTGCLPLPQWAQAFLWHWCLASLRIQCLGKTDWTPYSHGTLFSKLHCTSEKWSDYFFASRFDHQQWIILADSKQACSTT